MKRTSMLLLLATLAACRKPLSPDLFREDSLKEASVAGKDRRFVLKETGRPLRLNDVVRRTLPASPPSRLRYVLDLPKGAHLALACGIDTSDQARPGVEFVVKARRGGSEEEVFTALVDPANRAEHRDWVKGDVDLSKYAGAGAEVILETRGFSGGESEKAFWGDPTFRVPDRKAPLSIIWLVDTLRADHTTPYGYSRETTPALAAFAKDSVVFETAIAQASWTKPSVASLLTSELPGIHRAVQLRDPLDPSQRTLPEMLQEKGYATGAAIANWVIYSEGGNFEKGFSTFTGIHDSQDHPSKDVPASSVVDASLEWLDARRGAPLFLYAHTMDPHVPYSPPAPFNSKFEPHPTEGHPGVDPRTDYKEAADRERLIAQYDGDVAYGDQEFGRFLGELKRRGLYEEALIVFMADHGEEFLDHGGWLHGSSVFDELVKIPLIVKFPEGRWAGTRVKQQVQEVDVLPTILEKEALPFPPLGAIAGRPLQGVLKGDLPEVPAISEISHRGFVSLGVRTGRDKYIHRFSPDPAEMYFDLIRDPREQLNRIEETKERARVLKASVELAMSNNPFRYSVRVAGAGDYTISLTTGGWIENVETAGFASKDQANVDGNGRILAVHVAPRPGQPREVSFGLRPLGVHVELMAQRDGRPVAPKDVSLGSAGAHPKALPFDLPDLEGGGVRTGKLFQPPSEGPAGIAVWLKMAPGRKVLETDREALERLKALGYLPQN